MSTGIGSRNILSLSFLSYIVSVYATTSGQESEV